ncbi:ribonuclease PH [Anaerofustis sp.]|uniref:ribonuclease PH n=1 Tax=Anaerofustis sp. TaxID=1872517 RepID=UPI0025BED40A|nr:ribonuclease PH [Anaerofustis sp.]
MERFDGRKYDEKRKVKITKNYTMYPDGCVLIEVGNTKVICSAFVENRVPPFLRGEGTGWITCEYSMLPSSTQTRKQRDINRLKLDGRSSEIQRLIGRSLRSVVDLNILGEKTVMIDCDVIQADGGTRVASITGAFVALYDALNKMVEKGEIERLPLTSFVAAISVGVVENEALLDLCYVEDSNAIVDMNVVMNEYGEYIELGMTGEQRPVKEEELNKLLLLAKKGVKELIDIQRDVLELNK